MPAMMALVLAAASLVLASSPWLGAWVPAIDALSPAWPLSPMLALAALASARLRGIASIVALAALGLCVPTLLAIPRPNGATTVQADAVRLRVVTHNVWAANDDPAGTAAALLASGADLLLLQEVDQKFAGALPLLRRSYPFYNPCSQSCSLAILSRYPLDRVKYGFRLSDGRPIGPGLIQTRVHLPNGAVFPVATIHLPRGRPLEQDRRQRVSLAAAVRTVDTRSLILAGDFNLVPWSSRLRWLDTAMMPLRRVTSAPSWPARVGDHSFPLPLVPIDHLYAGPDWALAAVHRLDRTGSDHYPIAVDLIWHGPTPMISEAR
jgi:endonuclease/exonuclease/phosphatase (EEP) superfamily protein YafD